jgi:hypothetical protein
MPDACRRWFLGDRACGIQPCPKTKNEMEPGYATYAYAMLASIDVRSQEAACEDENWTAQWIWLLQRPRPIIIIRDA